MERQKVLYVARTKTAKVIRPTSLMYPLSLPSSSQPETETDHAPLASVEPEFVAVTRKAFVTNKSLRGQIRRPASTTNILLNDQVLRADSGTLRRESAHQEPRDHTPPRMYVKLRTTNTNSNHRENSNISGNQQMNMVKPGQFLSCAVLPSVSQQQAENDYDLTVYDRSLPILPSQNVSQEDNNRTSTNSSHGVQKMDKKSYRTNQHSLSTMTIRSNACPTQLNSFTKTPPPVAPKPKRICTKPRTLTDSKSDVAHYEHDPRNSDPRNSDPRNSKSNSFPSQGNRDRYLTSKENYIESSQSLQDNILGLTQPSKENVQFICEPGRLSSQSPDQLLTLSASAGLNEGAQTRFNNLGREHSNIILQPEIDMPVKFLFHDKDPLPEMYRFSASLNTTDIRPKISHRPAQRNSHISQPRSGPRKPLVAIDTSFNKPQNGKQEQSMNVRLPDQNTNEKQLHSDCNYQTAHVIAPNRRQSIGKDLSSVPQLGSVPTENLDLFFPEAEFRNSWKRNSMRLATQGYTSMSDLTNSLECLVDNQSEVAANTFSQSRNELVNSPQIRKIGLCAETSSSNLGASEICDSVLVASKPEMLINSDVVYEGDNETTDPCTDHEPFNGFSSQEEPETLLQRSGITRLSYRMATSSSLTDISLLTDCVGELPDMSHQMCVVVKNNNNNRDSDTFSRSSGVRKMKHLKSNKVARHEAPVADGLMQQMLVSDGQEGQGYKRLSFTLATCSISDLTFPPYANYDNALFSLIPNCSANRKPDDTDSKIKSTGNSGFYTPESPHEEGSSYSSGRHSSFGSVYSFRSLDTGRAKHPQDQSVSRDKQRAHYSTDQKDTPLPDTALKASDSSDSDGSTSDDTTFYYTASSDTSFVTTNGDTLSCQHLSGTTHQSPPCEQKKSLSTLPLQDQISHESPSRNQRHITKQPQDRWSPKVPAHGRKSPGISTRDHKSPYVLSQGQKLHNLPAQGQKQESYTSHQVPTDQNLVSSHEAPLKRSSPVNNTFQCHDNGLSDVHNVQNHRTRNNSCRRSLINRTIERNEHSIGDPTGNNSSYLTQRAHVRLSDDSPRHLPIQTLPFKETDLIPTSSFSSSFGSLNSAEQCFPWEEAPRFPPSLGKPRRKLYAGFDSQPLPMDSFISDSSSMYSVETCGSWGASRSAEVESCSKTLHVSQNIRAVSSIVSSTCAPVRCISQEEMLDLFRYADKAFSAGENIHNIYVNDRFQGNCYDKTFSSESLKSVRSDDTIVGIDHHERDEDHEKLSINATKPDTGGTYSYGGDTDWREKTRNGRRQLDNLNNSYGLDFGSKVSNNTFVGGNVVNTKNQLKTVKGKKYGQPFCMCRQSSLDRFTATDGNVSVILRDTGQWDISL